MFRIAQISDTHLSAGKPFFVDNFRRIGEAIRAAAPDLVLNSGDMSLDGASSDADLAAARALHDELGLPVRFLPGNHDLGDPADSTSHADHVIDDSRRARYGAHFGPDFWSFDVPGWRLLGVNAQLLGSSLAAERDQDSAIRQAAAMLGDRRLALFVHRPLFDKSPEESEVTGRFLNPVPRRALFDALGDCAPGLVASGHVHQYRAASHNGCNHVWGPSTGFVIPDSRQPRYGLKEVGYVEHRLEPDGGHASRLVRVPGVPTLNIADFPDAYGPI
jgi:3',5'-cyclic AMP phosphodiesterase CpdA